MDTRTLGYVGLGVLVGIVVATLIGIPPVIWIAAALVALVGSAAVMLAQSNGSSDARRMLSRETTAPVPATEPAPSTPTRSSNVEMELVREADEDAGTPAVWLHRRGGRRVHRYESGSGWVVERVSTKDPDDARKRIIGEPISLATERDAITAADELAQGQVPTTPYPERTALAAG